MEVGPHYQGLVELIKDELGVAFAMRSFGDCVAAPEDTRIVAELIAAEVDWAYSLAPKASEPKRH
jgi:hypothetical protein